MTLNKIRTERHFFELIAQNKSGLGKTLMSTFLRSQRPKNGVFIFPPAMDVPLSLVQAVSIALESLSLKDNLDTFEFIDFQFGGYKHVLAKNGSHKRTEIEHLQKITGGLQSDTVEDVATIRIIYFPSNGEYPDASDCPLYKILK